MIYFKKQGTIIYYHAVILLVLGLIWSCKTTTPDLKGELVRSLQGEDVNGFNFAIEGDENQTVVSLTNSALRNLITLDNNTTSFNLKFTLVKDKKSGITKTYKTEIVKQGTDLTLVVTDIASGKVVSRSVFPKAEPHHLPGGAHNFDTLEECIEDFYCTTAPTLQCEANRTCEDQFASLLCCLNDGLCYSVHMIIRPNTWRCKLSVMIPNRGVFVIRQ